MVEIIYYLVLCNKNKAYKYYKVGGGYDGEKRYKNRRKKYYNYRK